MNHKLIICLFSSILSLNAFCSKKQVDRLNISLNGQWSITKSKGNLPQQYSSKIDVPGLVDMAKPALDSLKSQYKDSWYWYKRNFVLNSIDFDILRLKVFKAQYHTKVYINNRFVGENLYCFTPSYYDIKPFLNPSGKMNEIVIGVGNFFQLPDTIPNGFDFEKRFYIPGIYDNVEITMSNKPFISNVQVAPDIITEKLNVEAEIEINKNDNTDLEYEVRELKSGKVFCKGKANSKLGYRNGITVLSFEILMKKAILWTPEKPFLYNLILRTTKDKKELRFGMRSFRFDSVRKVALLNEKPYYLRGTNVCISRFFEDSVRDNLPWNSKWILKLHKRFKDMHWNVMRYTIGYPPERWYDIADSLGFLIQDEFPLWEPVWFKAPKIKANHLASELEKRLRESWNHPSIVIWDAQNETVNEETGKAIAICRKLDLSNRPWENGWSTPQLATDPIEAHPYLFGDTKKKNNPQNQTYLKSFFGINRIPHCDVNQQQNRKEKGLELFNNPCIINEYGWLWLNRDGSTTTLTDSVYLNLWGNKLTSNDRRIIYAKHLAILTEYWRAHRQAAGVLHFTALSYSRPNIPRGQTSDNWADVSKLEFDPFFFKYVRPSFSPVGLMLDIWEKQYKSGSNLSLPVYITNDLEQAYKGLLLITLKKNNKDFISIQKKIMVDGYKSKITTVEFNLPEEIGLYELKAEIVFQGESVMSCRDIKLINN